MIRPIAVEDIPWVMSLAHERYQGFDPGGALQALATAMRLPTALAWRDDHAFLVGNITQTLWYPKRRQFEVLAICAEEGHHWQAVALLRASAKWARAEGCARWTVNSDTDHPVGALAERFGAKAVPHYVIDFTEGSP